MLSRRTLLAGTALSSLLVPARGALAHLIALRGGGSPNGSGGQTITPITITETSGVNKTNEMVRFGLPLSASALGANQYVAVYDDNGSGSPGSLLANFSNDNLSSDLNGNTRWMQVSCVVPNLTANQTKKLFAITASGSGPSGTPITASDILATSAEIEVSYDFQGTIYTTSMRDALTNAVSTWTSTGNVTDVYHGNWLNNGVCTCLEYSAPPRSGGAGTEQAGGNGLRTHFHIYAYKAQSGAVSVSNPITLLEVDVLTENGAVDRASGIPANFLYGLNVQRATSLTDSTLINTDDTDPDGNIIRYSFPQSQPAGTLTLGSGYNGTNANSTATLSAGTWDADIIGAVIGAPDGGIAYVTKSVSPTEVDLWVCTPFGSASYASGGWTQWGQGHSYGGRSRRRVYIGTKRTNITCWGSDTNAQTPTTTANRDYCRSTGLIPYFVTAINNTYLASDMASGIALLNNMKSDSQYRPFTFLGGTAGYAERYAELYTFIDQTGFSNYIGILPNYDIAGLTTWSIDGRRRIFENLDEIMCAPMSLRNYALSVTTGSFGVWPRPDCGTTFKRTSSMYQAHLINEPSAWIGPGNVGLGLNGTYAGIAHGPDVGYIAYLTTGDLYALEEMQFRLMMAGNYCQYGQYMGLGINCTPYGDSSFTYYPTTPTGGQRGAAWWLRDLIDVFLCTPDIVNPQVIGIPSSAMQTWLKNAYVRFAGMYPANTGTGLNYWASGTDGPHWTAEGTNESAWSGDIESPWMDDYGRGVFNHAREAGCLDSNGQSSFTWFLQDTIGRFASADVAPDYYTDNYRVVTNNFTGSSPVTLWGDCYQNQMQAPHGVAPSGGQPANTGPYSEVYIPRTPPSAMTLSAVSGSSITATWSSGSPFAAGAPGGVSPGWYVGGWIYEFTSGTGAARITAINADNSVTLDTTATFSSGNVIGQGNAFSSLTIAAADHYIPLPHPADAAPVGTVAITDAEYAAGFLIAAMAAQDAGMSGAAAAVIYMKSRAGMPALSSVNVNLDIGLRGS